MINIKKKEIVIVVAVTAVAITIIVVGIILSPQFYTSHIPIGIWEKAGANFVGVGIGVLLLSVFLFLYFWIKKE